MSAGPHGSGFRAWGSQSVTAEDVEATDDLTVGDDATIGDDLAVTGDLTVTGTSTLKGTTVIGDGTGSESFVIDKSDAGTSEFLFRDGGALANDAKRILQDTDETLKLQSRVGGAWQDVYTVANAGTGTFALDQTFTTDVYVGSQLTVGATSSPLTQGGWGEAVVGSSYGTIWMDVTADATNKSTRLGIKHYTNTEEPSAFAYIANTINANEINIGGGTALLNAATTVRLYTAADNTTTTGTLRGSVTSAGVLDWVTDVRARTYFADGDEGTGIASTVGLTNVVAAAGDTAAVLGNWRVNGSAGTFHGWLKLWDGTTYISVPCWRAT